MLSKEYAVERAKLIDLDHANCDVSPGALVPDAGDTTYLSVVDREGNMVSLIESNYSEFGSGLVAEGTGFILHNRGALFNLTPVPPMHSRDTSGRCTRLFRRSWRRIRFVSRSASWAGGTRRRRTRSLSPHGGFQPEHSGGARNGAIHEAEFRRMRCAARKSHSGKCEGELEAKGHKLTMHNGYSDVFGGGQAVMRDYGTGVNYGASDPRKDGEAVPELTITNWQQ